jgi:hypothetical protein
MSGPLAQHCPAQRETDEIIGVKHVLSPGGVYKDGRCVEWNITFVPRYRHVLVPLVEPVRTSKHARGRIRPRTAKEQRRAEALLARFAQISKSHTVDHNTLRAIHDEVAA